MLLAESIALVFVGLILIGLVGFFLVAVLLVVRFLGFVFRALTGVPKPAAAAARFEPRHEVCPHHRCGHVNRRGACFCARCGRPLRQHDDVDAYG